VVRVEQVGLLPVDAFLNPHLQGFQEAVDRQHELVANQQDRLQTSAVAAAQRRRQFAVRVAAVGVKPLFELIQQQHDFAPAKRFRMVAQVS